VHNVTLIDDLQLQYIYPTTAQRCRSGTEKNILEGLFCSVLSKFEKDHPSGNLIFNNLDIFKSLKLRNLMGKIFRIYLKLNFTPNTLGWYEIYYKGQQLLQIKLGEKINQNLHKCKFWL